jgi:glycosyltransferase involved in cell wall biosynthesis
MRVLFFGDLAATGFGSVTNDLGKRLIALGDDVRFWSLNETPELDEPFASRTLSVLSLEVTQEQPDFIANLLSGKCPYKLYNGEPWGDWTPEAAIVLGDFAAARIFIGQHLDSFKALPTYHYVPVEGVRLPPLWKELWDVVKPVAMSKFGAAEIAKVVGYDPPMIYHGVDTTAFYPASKKRPIVIAYPDQPDLVLTNQRECRSIFIPGMRNDHPLLDETWILRTDRHMPRKRYNSLIRALVPVLASVPKSRAIFHCRAHDQGGYLHDTLSKVPALIRNRFLLTEMMGMSTGVPRTVLNALYNACDLYVTVSAEGFGLTVAEALACGLPAVGPAYSAVPEVIGPAGITVEAGFLVDNEYDHFWWGVDEPAFGAAVEHLLVKKNRRAALAAKGPEHIRRNFSWDAAAAAFRDLIHSSSPVEAAA